MKLENALYIERYVKLHKVPLDTIVYGYNEPPDFIDHYKMRPVKIALGTVRELLEALEKARRSKWKK